ncbi:MAG: pyrroline-5-carboxylate reductase [Defluviitaleaceae bacterium]|nr:pyrroline-5-carboxylate reductase [Defluviitaleaceae bacterium]
MGSAIIGGVVKANLYTPNNITASDINTDFLADLEKSYGINTTTSNTEVAQNSDILFLCVKPNLYSLIIKEIKNVIPKDTVVVTIAAGQTLDMVASQFESGTKIVRTMPNTPALVNQGMTAICPGSGLTKEEIDGVSAIFNSVGKSAVLNESLFNIFTGVAGSAPAYVFMFIEAMGDAGVKHGLTKAQALTFAAQTVMGAATMVIETGQHPAVLKDAVCSPGGTTIEAVCDLEFNGFRDAVISAVSACVEKAKQMED